MEILFEDQFVLAVNKPSGVPSNHLSESSVDTPSVEKQISAMYAPNQTHLLHRLDVGTSGVLLFARDLETYSRIRDLFRLKQMKKRYWAWSEKKLETELPLEITRSLAHHPKSKKRMILVDPIKMASRPQTFYRGNPFPAHTKILAMTPTSFEGSSVYRYDVEITTGVTHQIRVHLQHLGIPLIGDPIYGDQARENIENQKTRLGLHAHKIEFQLNDYLYQIEAPAP